VNVTAGSDYVRSHIRSDLARDDHDQYRLGEAATLSYKQSQRARRLRSRLGQLALLLVIYYLVPVRETTSVPDQIVRGAFALVVLVGVVTWITREVVRQSSQRTAEVNRDRLLLMVVAGLMFFALVDLVVARSGPSEFVGVETKTDALYFALTTLATVGFGDVHAEGQVARVLLIVQMTFNVVVLTRAAQVLLASRAVQRLPDQGE
jgi:voltage-gated potassium channel